MEHVRVGPCNCGVTLGLMKCIKGLEDLGVVCPVCDSVRLRISTEAAGTPGAPDTQAELSRAQVVTVVLGPILWRGHSPCWPLATQCKGS